jgi:4a-hydroxytetrahydrobiopterin dehydratase
MSNCSLQQKTCTPCKGGIPPLSKSEAEAHLVEVPDWQLNSEATVIQKRFCFKSFAQALAFANKVGELAEREGHHPVLQIGWGFCTVSFSTSKIKGLHENDFIMASKVNSLG